MYSLQRNKMIAEFMGHELVKPQRGVYEGISHYKSTGLPKAFSTERNEVYQGRSTVSYEVKKEFFPKDLNYHKSWEWLMPVLIEIDMMGYLTTIHSFGDSGASMCVVYTSLQEICQDVGDTKLEATYRAVVKFIEWLNEQKK